MRILVACEESQAVTKEFRKLGHEAYSCDIIDCSGGKPDWHIKGDALELLEQDWDMIIAFPPCTDICVSGARHFAKKRENGTQQKSIEFFLSFVNANCPRIAVENPVGIMSTMYRKPDQIIQPYDFGEDASKKTCLWLKGLPLLQPTKYIEPRIVKGTKRWSNQYYSGQNNVSSKERAKVRSKTYLGIAEAMAKQWGI